MEKPHHKQRLLKAAALVHNEVIGMVQMSDAKKEGCQQDSLSRAIPLQHNQGSLT